MTTAALAACNLGLTYRSGDRTVVALDDVNVSIDPGEVVALRGVSGSGKTSLLQVLGMLIRPGKGSLSIGGEDCAELSERARSDLRRRHVGFMFQAFHLVPQLDALRNVVLAAWDPATADGRARQLLDELGVGHRLRHKPAELSGGEQQRVALARALVNRPTVLLADEPTGNLDADNEQLILKLLTAQAAAGTSVVLATHSQSVSTACGRQLVMTAGRLTEGTS